MRIRECKSTDYPDLAVLYGAVYPDRDFSADTFVHDDRTRDPKFQFKRWIAVMDEGIVGTAMYYQREWFYHPRTFRVGGLVAPHYRGRGIGSALYDQVIAGLQPFNPIVLIADTHENCPDNIRFLKRRGFEIFVRDRELRLDVAAFDSSRFGDYEGRLRAQGIEIKSASELADDPKRNRKLYELDRVLNQSAPQAEYAPERSFEEYIDFALTGATALPDGFFVALDGTAYIGLTHVAPRDKQILYQLMTGVRPAYRRKGIALALKLRSIAHARAGRIKTIITNNDPSNQAMLAVNARLGFVPQPDHLFFRKELQTG